MQSILTITTNPAVDMATSVAQVVAGPKLRCKPPRWDAGGGGVNVARAIKKLGGDALALVAVGGPLGDRLLSLLDAEDVSHLAIPVSAETRISFAVTDEESGEQFRFGVPGDALTKAEGAILLDKITGAARNHTLVVYSGSIAPGLPHDFVGQIQSAISDQGTRLVVDTSAAALAQLLARPEGVFVLRLDLSEAEAAAQHPLTTIESCRQFALSLVEKGVAEIVVLGRGADGSVLVSKDIQIHAWGPKVPVRSKIGAGDTFVGAFTLGLARGESLPKALMRGVAGASATVQTEGTELCVGEDADAIFAQCDYVEL
jgi:6-phosphofructokinase 2